MADVPVKKLAEDVSKLLRANPGAKVFFKFTCAHCRSRQTFDVPNTLYAQGKCEECGQVTDITEAGYVLWLDVNKNQGGA